MARFKKDNPVNVDLLGDENLKKLMGQIRGPIARRVMRGGIRAAMSPINKAAKKNAPKESGALKKAIAIKVWVNHKTGNIVGMVGVRHNVWTNGKIANLYAQRVEMGWDYRGSTAPTGNRRKRGGKGKKYPKFQVAATATRYEVGTSTHAPRPFLRPALESQRGAALAVLTNRARMLLSKEIDKNRARGKAVFK